MNPTAQTGLQNAGYYPGYYPVYNYAAGYYWPMPMANVPNYR
jgi:hypothetical protein